MQEFFTIISLATKRAEFFESFLIFSVFPAAGF